MWCEKEFGELTAQELKIYKSLFLPQSKINTNVYCMSFQREKKINPKGHFMPYNDITYYKGTEATLFQTSTYNYFLKTPHSTYSSS